MRTIFGPIPSRRLGQSLGIDPVPSKTCNWNCVYCQLGRSKPMVNKRAEYIPREIILTQIQETLTSHIMDSVNWITFVGSGEPTLHSGLGWLIAETKKLTKIPVAVITNGSLLYQPEVRLELMLADAVLPSLDAGDPETYKKINRPFGELTYKRLVDGLIAFRQEYTGHLWVEIMLVAGVNDTLPALKLMAEKLQLIQPNQVHITLPVRPPAEPWVHPPDDDGVLRAKAVLGEIAKIARPFDGKLEISGHKNLTDAIVGIITRHPMREDQLVEVLIGWDRKEVHKTLSTLASEGRIQSIERYGVRFWSMRQAYYAEKQ